MSDKSVMSARQAAELDHAFERNGWTPADVKRLSQGDILAKVLDFISGKGEKVMEVVKTFLTFLMRVPFSPQTPKRTELCFKHSRYIFRDVDMDKVLLSIQKDQLRGSFWVFRGTQRGTLKQMIEAWLMIKGNIVDLSEALKNRGNTIALSTIEALIQSHDAGGSVGLTTAMSNFFFVEGQDGVVVLQIAHSSKGWSVFLNQLDDDFEWIPGHHFFFRS